MRAMGKSGKRKLLVTTKWDTKCSKKGLKKMGSARGQLDLLGKKTEDKRDQNKNRGGKEVRWGRSTNQKTKGITVNSTYTHHQKTGEDPGPAKRRTERKWGEVMGTFRKHDKKGAGIVIEIRDKPKRLCENAGDGQFVCTRL